MMSEQDKLLKIRELCNELLADRRSCANCEHLRGGEQVSAVHHIIKMCAAADGQPIPDEVLANGCEAFELDIPF